MIFDLQDKVLLEIILFSMSKGFGLICGLWAFPITPVIILWDERTRLSFWTSARDLGVPLGWHFLWAWRVGLSGGPVRLFFKPYRL